MKLDPKVVSSRVTEDLRDLWKKYLAARSLRIEPTVR